MKKNIYTFFIILIISLFIFGCTEVSESVQDSEYGSVQESMGDEDIGKDIDEGLAEIEELEAGDLNLDEFEDIESELDSLFGE